MVPYIVDLTGMSREEKVKALAKMNTVGLMDSVQKVGTEQSYILHDKIPVSDMAELLGIEVERITAAEGWDLKQWLRQ